MNLFGNRRSSHQDSTPSISFSMGMPSLPTSSQQQAESSPSPSSSTLNREASSTPSNRPLNGKSSPEIELVTPQSSSSVVQARILPEFTIDYESDDDTFEDVEFGGTNTPSTTNGRCDGEQETNQRITRRLHASQWIPTNMVQFGVCLGIVTFVAVAVIVVVMSVTSVSSPAAASNTASNTNAAINAATGSTFQHNNVTEDSIWISPPGNSTRRALRHLYP